MKDHKPIAKLLYIGLESQQHAAECRKEYKELTEKVSKFDNLKKEGSFKCNKCDADLLPSHVFCHRCGIKIN